MKVFFKFRDEVSSDARARALRQLRDRGATNVARLFPRTKAPDLAGRYFAESTTEAGAQGLVSFLTSLPEIDYAQKEVKRRVRGPDR